MADEITVSGTLRMKNGAIDERRQVSNLKVDQAALDKVGNMQDVGFAAHEALDFGDLTTPGYAYIRNNDDTNYVEIGVDVAATFYPLIRLNGNSTDAKKEFAIFRISPGVTVYVKANTAAVQIDKFILEN